MCTTSFRVLARRMAATLSLIALLIGAALASGGCSPDDALLVAPGARIAPNAGVYPLSIGADGRTLRDATGARYTMSGEAAWSLVVQLTPNELQQYLDDRRGGGFNAIYVNLIEHLYSAQDPAWVNRQGDAPFTRQIPGTSSLDFTAPNENYWLHVDRIIDEAANRGILVVAFPAYLGYRFNESGWASELEDNGVDRCRAYGEWLGQRYGTRVNLMWSMGGDWGPEYAGRSVRAEIDALAAGLETTAPSQWITAHSSRDRSALDDYDQPWLDLNTAYGSYIPAANDVTVPVELVDADQNSGAMPFFFIEGQYENEYDTPVLGIRSQAYWSVLTGAVGHFYGNNPVWAFGSASVFADDTSITWQQALDLPGARDMAHFATFLRVHVRDALVPDTTGSVLVAGKGDVLDESFAACAVNGAGTQVLVYSPDDRTLTLDLSFFAASIGSYTWFDPSDGRSIGPEPFEVSGSTAFTPPSAGDWVLIVQNSSPDTGVR